MLTTLVLLLAMTSPSTGVYTFIQVYTLYHRCLHLSIVSGCFLVTSHVTHLDGSIQFHDFLSPSHIILEPPQSKSTGIYPLTSPLLLLIPYTTLIVPAHYQYSQLRNYAIPHIRNQHTVIVYRIKGRK